MRVPRLTMLEQANPQKMMRRLRAALRRCERDYKRHLEDPRALLARHVSPQDEDFGTVIEQPPADGPGARPRAEAARSGPTTDHGCASV